MRSLRLLACGILAVITADLGRAQTLVSWASVSSDFNSALSWIGGITPVDDTTTHIAVFGTAGVPTFQPVLAANRSVGGIRFDSTAGNFNFTGAGVLSVGVAGIENRSTTATQSVGVPLSFTGTTSTVTNEGTLTISGAITNNTANGLVLGGAGLNGNLSGSISGPGALEKTGTGRWSLTGANTYTGPTRVSGGTLAITTDASLGLAPTVATASHLVLNGGTLSISTSFTLNANRGVELAANGGSIVTSGAASLTIPGSITGAGGLTVSGTGRVSLGGYNSYDGATTVNSGTLAVSGFSPLGNYAAGGTTVNSGASLQLENAAIWGEALTVGGTGSGVMGVPGAIVATTGWNVLEGATLTLSAPTSIGVVADASLTINEAIGESGGAQSLTKTGFGWLYLNGGSYTGGTIINAGQVMAGVSNALPAGGNVRINGTQGAASLQLGSTTQSIGSLTFGGAGGLAHADNSVYGYGSQLSLAGGITYDAQSSPSTAWISGGTLSLGTGSHAFVIGDSANATTDLSISSQVAGGGGIVKTGAGVLSLEAANTFTGGLTIDAGTVVLAENTAAGTGTIRVGGSGTVAATHLWSSMGGDLVVPNAVVVAHNATLGSTVAGDRGIRLTGPVTADAAVTTIHLGGDEAISLSGVFDAVSPGTSVTFDSGSRPEVGAVVLRGSVGANIGTLTASSAALLFASPAAISTASVRAVNGYVGVAAPATGLAPSAAALLGRITDRTGFSGTFGFDTDLESYTPFTFGEAVNFSGFGSGFTIGSMTSAILSGAITPPAGGYAFGNGGGTLYVRGALGGAYGLSVNSSTAWPENSLTVVLQGANSFNGGVSVANSLAVLDGAGALPAGVNATLGANGYFGYTERAGFANFAAFAGRIAGYTGSSILGFDSGNAIAHETGTATGTSGSARLVSETIDLTNFGPVYIGTATAATLTGNILAPNQAGADRTLSLIGAKGGHLSLQASLQEPGVKRLVIGSTSEVLGHGTVEIGGQSTFTGGATLLSGNLVVRNGSKAAAGATQSGPLGTGTLAVPATALAPTLAKRGFGDVVLHNLITLGGILQLGFLDSYYGDVSAMTTSSTLPGTDRLVLEGVISGAGSLVVMSDTALNAANTFTGGVAWHGGELTLGHDAALGTGALKVDPYGTGAESVPSLTLNTGTGARTIANALVLGGYSGGDLYFTGQGPLTFNGGVTLNAELRLVPDRYSVTFNGPISGYGSMVVGGSRPVILNGAANSYSGGTRVDEGLLIFGSAAAIPAAPVAGLQTGFDGYIGVASTAFATSLQGSFVNRFNKASSYGTVGLDSTGGVTNTFTGNIDLTGFANSARLGSATTAYFSGTLTPAGANYAFGGGGGLLIVNSALGNGSAPRALELDSPALAPLTLRLAGANTYSGTVDGVTTRVSSSALIFQSGAMPAGATFLVTGGGYIGTEDTAAAQAFVDRFAKSGHDGIIGFDAVSGTANVSSALNLGAFDSTSTVYLGSATAARLSGALTLPAGQTAYRFAGYKGGVVQVDSVLANDGATARSVVIGEPDTPATMGSPASYTNPSRVVLTGANTYSGGTSLYAGQLLLGSNAALGSGLLSVWGPAYWQPEGSTLPETPMLAATVAGLTVANPVALNTGLTLSDGAAMTLAGAISGTGGLLKTGSQTVTLSGTNTFSGGIQIVQGNLTFTNANASGIGLLELDGALSPSATFDVSAIVQGIAGDATGGRINVAAGTTLTVNQQVDAVYAGQFTFGTGASLALRGPSATEPRMLRLTSAGTQSGSTSINGGIVVVAGANDVFGSSASTVQLNGGKLVLASGVTLRNALTLTSGALGGTGTFQLPATARIRDGVTLAPGFGAPGVLTFADSLPSLGNVLTLEGGGQYLWRIADATNAVAGWDRVVVNGSVAIAATATAPFNFRIVPGGEFDLLGSIANFDPYASYSWPVLTATSISGFASNAFTFDTTQVASLISGGSFSFSLNATNTALLLNFTPVPEPSTYAMLGLGAIVLLFAHRRRRHR